MLSAMIERALLPVQRNNTLKTRSAISSLLRWAARGEIGDQRRAQIGAPAAAILEQVERDFAEAREVGAERFRAFSAGSHPKGAVNPFALKVLESYDYPTDDLRSKGWDEFAAPGAPVMDFVFTVCDTAAAEVCPVWPGQPMTAHWGIEDPATVEGTDIQKEAAFVLATKYLRNRISIFVSLPIRSLDKMALNAKLREIGGMEGATAKANGAK